MNTNLVGKIFGHLKVIRFHKKEVRKRRNGHISYWVCECLKCGAKEVFQQSLLTGKSVRSCTGCQRSMPKAPTSNKGIQKTKPRDICNLDRSTLEGFSAYFCAFPNMFETTFDKPFSPENVQQVYNEYHFTK